MMYIGTPRGSCIKLAMSANYRMGTQIELPELDRSPYVINGKKVNS